jgi:hypothetical protein
MRAASQLSFIERAPPATHFSDQFVDLGTHRVAWRGSLWLPGIVLWEENAMAGPIGTELRFARDIKPLFRDEDQGSMLGFGLDLYDYAQVKDRAVEILERISDGSMPCDEAWPQDRVALFRRWLDAGCPA